MRLRANNQSAKLGAPLGVGDTTINFGTIPSFQAVGGSDYYAISLDFGQTNFEIVHLTGFLPGATTGTIVRGQEGTTAQVHQQGVCVWFSGPDALDFSYQGAIFQAREYGAYGDGVVVMSQIVDVQGFATTRTDGVMNAGTGSRTDGPTGVSFTSGSAVVNDTACVAADLGKKVSSNTAGIPTGTVVTAVTPGTSFTMSTPATANSTGGTSTITLTINPNYLATVGGTFDANNDLGKVVRVAGADTSGAPLHSCIDQWIAPNVVQLHNKAQVSVSGATFVYGTGSSMSTVSTGSGYLASNAEFADNLNAVFTGQHVGYVAVVRGAGAAGADLVTTVNNCYVPSWGLNTSGANLILAQAASTDVICGNYTLGPGYQTGSASNISTGNVYPASGGGTTLEDNINTPFVTTDVGKTVLVPGANPGGQPSPAASTSDLLTYITAYTSNSKVTLAHPMKAPTVTVDSSVTLTSGSLTATSSTTSNAVVGYLASGTTANPHLAVGTTVTAVSGTTITLSQAPTQSGTLSMTYSPPQSYLYSFGGQVTAGSATLYDPNGKFAVSDVTPATPKVVTVRNGQKTIGWGNSCNQNTLLSTITAQADAQHVTMAAPATSSSCCATYVYGHDDATAINNAYAAMKGAGGGVVDLTGGTYVSTQQIGDLNGGPPWTLRGSGKQSSSLVLVGHILQGGFLQVKYTSNFVLERVTIDGNLLCPQLLYYATSDGALVRGLHIDGVRFTATTQGNNGQWTVHIDSNHSYMLTDVKITNTDVVDVPTAHQDIISLDQTDGAVLDDLLIENVNQALYTFGSVNCKITGSLFRWVRGRANNGFICDAQGTSFNDNTFVSCDPLQVGGQVTGTSVAGNTLIDTQIAVTTKTAICLNTSIVGNNIVVPQVPTWQNQLNCVVLLSTAWGLSFANNPISSAWTAAPRVVWIQNKSTGGQASRDLIVNGNAIRSVQTGGAPIIQCDLDSLVEPTVAPNCSMAAGSFDLISATAVFASGNVGLSITVSGAGRNGGPLNTQIQSFVSSTHVVLAQHGKAAVSGALAVFGGAGGLTLADNILDGLNSGASGLQVNNSGGIQVHHNQFPGFVGATAISDNSTVANFYDSNYVQTGSVSPGSAGVWRNNPGYNPVTVTTPAFPASGNAWTNTTTVDVLACIATGAGVTVSAISIGGQATGLSMTANAALIVPVPALQTLTPTYAGGTPTWKLIGQ